MQKRSLTMKEKGRLSSMPLFNTDKIVRLVSEMRKAVSYLTSRQGLGKDVFLNDPDKIGSVQRSPEEVTFRKTPR
jgi:hypothetical protein